MRERCKQAEGRKVALNIHNCPAHPIIENLSHVFFFIFFFATEYYIQENLKELWEKEPSLVPENMTAEDFATADDAVITTSSTLTDQEISQETTQTENNEAEETEDDDEELAALSRRDVDNPLQILKNLSLFSEKIDDQMQVEKWNTSYELKSTSSKFKSTSYEFKFTSYEFEFTSNEFKFTG